MIRKNLQILGRQPQVLKVFLDQWNIFLSQWARTILETKYTYFLDMKFEKMGYCTDSAPRNGPYNSFKSPLLQQQKPEEIAKAEENPIDPRLKNIGRAHDMFSQFFFH